MPTTVCIYWMYVCRQHVLLALKQAFEFKVDYKKKKKDNCQTSTTKLQQRGRSFSARTPWRTNTRRITACIAIILPGFNGCAPILIRVPPRANSLTNFQEGHRHTEHMAPTLGRSVARNNRRQRNPNPPPSPPPAPRVAPGFRKIGERNWKSR